MNPEYCTRGKERQVSFLNGSAVQVSLPEQGCVRIQSPTIFAAPLDGHCRRFVNSVFEAPEVAAVEIDPERNHALISFKSVDDQHNNGVLQKIARALKLSSARPQNEKSELLSVFQRFLHGAQRSVAIYRYDNCYTTWVVKHDLPGRLRLTNELLYRRKSMCQAVERELMATLGVESYKVSHLTGSVLVRYNPRQITKGRILQILDCALECEEYPDKPDKPDLDFSLSTTALVASAAGQFAVPALLPPATLLFMYTSLPSFKGAKRLLKEEKRLGVDVLDAIVLSCCLVAGQIFAGCFMGWCLSLGRTLLQKTRDQSRRMLLDVFGKQPRVVYVLRDGVEVSIPLERLTRDDVILVKTGEVVPVDGIIKEGFAMIDQHALTGESAPAEKGVGDRVYASTVMLAGQIQISVDKAGSETASAQIATILNSTLEHKLASQTHGERLADKAVTPTLALGALAAGSMGFGGAVAVINCDLGTGIRMAAPLGMLTSLTLSAHQGILVKDGRALEELTRVDTVLFDKTGTLTREKPEVGRVVACPGFDENRIVQLAAAAEHKFTHPIARAIQEKLEELGLPMLETDESQYRVGFGISVGIDGHTVRVGSARFMKMEEITVPEKIEQDMKDVHQEGNTMILVSFDDKVAGAIEMRASERPEVRDIIDGLRKRGVKQLVIISGDHEKPTRSMAEKLGMDRYFAEVLPQDKAAYVELLQKEGRTVCFIGDGINDSIALKKANVSISLRGATSIATDTAQIVFMEESLGKLCALFDIAYDLRKNIKTSWGLIVVPNSLCVAGVFALGFGLWHSVLFNNVTMIASLINGLLPLRKASQVKALKELEFENTLACIQNENLAH